MRQRVTLKAPLRAIQYTGDNIDEVVEFGMGAFARGARHFQSESAAACADVLRKTDAENSMVMPGTWIVEIWREYMDEAMDAPSVYLMLSKEAFHRLFQTLPYVISTKDLTDDWRRMRREMAMQPAQRITETMGDNATTE